MQSLPMPVSLSAALRSGWDRFLTAAQARSRGGLRRAATSRARRNRARIARARPEAQAPDPIALTILAINRLGPATFRAATIGKPVTVTLPDRATLEIFRAALRQMETQRASDRLVHLEIETPAPAARAATG